MTRASCQIDMQTSVCVVAYAAVPDDAFMARPSEGLGLPGISGSRNLSHEGALLMRFLFVRKSPT